MCWRGVMWQLPSGSPAFAVSWPELSDLSRRTFEGSTLPNEEAQLGAAWMICVAALASCVSPEELRREDEATCAGYGFHPGTDAFAICLQRESLARRALTAYPPPPYWGYWGRGWGPYWP
jgi:hypothetical protein